jgi:hypothetical protein
MRRGRGISASCCQTGQKVGQRLRLITTAAAIWWCILREFHQGHYDSYTVEGFWETYDFLKRPTSLLSLKE